jgi:aldehyde dehydrogenase (NAD+)
VAHAAAEHLAGCTLELGGKSPCIIDHTANIKHTARRIAWGKALNAGQTCVAPDYLLVHSKIHYELVAAIKSSWADFYGSDPSLSPDYGRIVNVGHFDRLTALLTSGKGAIHGGRSDRSSRYIEPTLLTDIDASHVSMAEEIFGPILPVLKWNEVGDLDEHLRRHPNPLAFYVFTTQRSFSEKLIERHAFGGGCVNHIAHHLANSNLPFGGVRTSGLGQYHGKFGFDTFTHYKGIMDASPRFDLRLKYPPYKNRARWLKWIYR